MSRIAIYDRAMCCPTGVCGPGVDPELLRIAGVLDRLSHAGVSVERHYLSQDPKAFAENPEIVSLLKEEGADALPIAYIDGRLVSKGAYPSNDTIGEALGVDLGAAEAQDSEGGEHGCCCGGDGCCGGEHEKDGCCCGGDGRCGDGCCCGGESGCC
ncbi:arsenite efflux transporter metallochaperone ArsD [Atopobiaceae bacterium HCP3S3_F7]